MPASAPSPPGNRPHRALPRIDGLTRLRLQFWGMIGAVGLGVALLWRLREAGTLDGLADVAAILIGAGWAVGSLVAVLVLRRKNPRGNTPQAVAQAYNIDFVLKATIAMSNMVFAFALLFVSGSFAPVVAPSLAALAGLLLAAPLDADLDRYERPLRESLPDLDLRDALRRFRPGELGAETQDGN